MSETPEAVATQFDRAEYEAPAAAACAACDKPLPGSYYEINGRLACPACHGLLAEARRSGTSPGAFVKASLLGLAGGIVGALVWYGVRELTGYEAGIVAIVVGILVGNGVRKGAAGRGGILYQLLAVLLTYLAIVSTYVPVVIEGVRSRADAPSGAAAFVVLVVLALGVAFVAPFLGGLSNIIGILIVGIALYEAWVLNRKAPWNVSGPFQLAARAAPVAAP